MATDSPAKQRIERHLMRQRGAGARAVTASFGFCFGSSQPASSDATLISQELPAKRRKTILRDESVAVEHSSTAATRAKTEDETIKPAKSTKSRKQWALDEDEPPAKQQAVDVEDSFISALDKKQKRTTKSNIRAKGAEAEMREVEERFATRPAGKGRPRRHAAAAAATKVTDGFEEEAAPIAKKRREVPPVVKSSMSKKKGEDYLGDTQDVLSANTVEPAPKPGTRVARKTGKRNTINSDTVVEAPANVALVDDHAAAEDVPVSVPNDITSHPKAPKPKKVAPKPKKVAPKKRKEMHMDLEACHDPVEGAARDLPKLQHGVAEPLLPKPTDPVFIAVPKRTSKKQDGVRKDDYEKLSNASGSYRRTPLEETDMNIPPRSVSPDKSFHSSDATIYTTKKRGVDSSKLDTDSAKPARQPTAKRRKIQVERDDLDLAPHSEEAKTTIVVTIPGGDQSSNEHVSGPEIAARAIGTNAVSGELGSTSSSEVKCAKERVPKTTEKVQSTAKRKKPIDAMVSRPAILDAGPSDENVVRGSKAAEDEDVDWLFAPQEPKRGVKAGSKPPKVPAKATKSRTKMADIDLDDLLSNIASFAQSDSTKGHTSAETSRRAGKGPSRQKNRA